jgi:RNA polymerase sigma-70 factor (sigma-E family)
MSKSIKGDWSAVSEREDFRDFVVAHRRAWLNSAWMLTGDWDLAEDLVQGALLRTYPHWHRIAAEAPDAYVRRVIINLHASWWRRRWRRELPTSDVPEQANAVDQYGAVDQRDRVLAALRDLAPRQRATVVLRYFDDLPEAEIAAILNCSLGTVKSQLAKALANLRRSHVLVVASEPNEVTNDL